MCGHVCILPATPLEASVTGSNSLLTSPLPQMTCKKVAKRKIDPMVLFYGFNAFTERSEPADEAGASLLLHFHTATWRTN